MSATRTSAPAATPARPRTGAGRGFTLIEILVALAVIAIALAAIVNETAQHIGNAARLTDRTLAHWVAMNQITAQQLSASWPAVGATTGTAEMADREWHWTLIVSATEDTEVRRLDVEVRIDKEDETPKSSIIAYLGRPS